MTVAAEVGSTANQYRILAKLAVGGMAEIFLARGASVAGVARYCVLKRILRDRAHDAQLVQMFLDEARLAAQLQHPNIASVYDVGMLGESYFFTMEYVHGETVRALLTRAHALGRPLPLACVMTVIAAAAAGLHHAHERRDAEGRALGIVHRDVSPSNLMISFEGNTKLVDFGVAKADHREIETKSGTVKGKISYLSPEQCRGVRLDRRSDVFSLGIVLWEMLTGHRLYDRASDFETMTAIVHDEVPRPSSQRADLPGAIDAIAMKMLAKDPAERYQTADEVVEAIENASMRAGTILSTSAVARLMRDLFGTRPEPWLALPDDGRSAASLMSRPLPATPAPPPADPVEAELLEVPDLSTASQVLETEELPRANRAALARPALPGLPPPVQPDALDTDKEPELPVAADAESTLRAPMVSPAMSPTIIAAALPLGPFGGVLARAPHHAPPSYPVGASTLLGVEPALSTPAGGLPMMAGVPSAVGSQPLPPPPALASASDMIALPAPPPARRAIAPMAAVIGLATVAGIATVWLAMRTHRAPGEHVAMPAGPALDAAAPDTSAAPAGIVPPAPIDAAPADAPIALPADAAPIDAPVDVPATVDAAPARPARPPAPLPPAPAKPAPTAEVATAPPASSPQAPPQAAIDVAQLMRLFNLGKYEVIVGVCTKARPTADIAGPCLMAACQEHRGMQAARWLSLIDPSAHDALIQYCEGHGTPLR